MAKVKIQALDNAPFLVQGEIELVDGVGKTIPTTEETYLCRCGLSKNAPFCDGSHDGKFSSAVRAK
jgi:CDGSH-type Zn-finger protein